MKKFVLGHRLVFLVLAFAAFVTISLTLFLPHQKAQDTANGYDKFDKADSVTRDIRDGSKGLIRVNVATAADRDAVAKHGRIVADYGSFVIIATARGKNISSLKLESQPIETSINLPGKVVDPISDPPAGTLRPGAEVLGGGNYYIVQFGGIAKDEWLDSLRGEGVEILQYVPHNAFFVYAEGSAIEKAANHSRVRWAGSFLPEYKISSVLKAQLSAAESKSQPGKGISALEMTGENTSVFDVAVFKRAKVKDIAARITADFGGKVRNIIDLPNNYFNVVRVELPLDRVIQTADIPGVINIDFYGKPRIEDERAAQIVAGNFTGPTTIAGPGYNPLTQFGVDGSGVTVSVFDDGVAIPGAGGLYITSANTVDGPLRGATAGADGGHGHINASIIAGNTPFGILDPTGHNYGLGVAPRANIINIPALKNAYSGSEADTYNDTVTTAGPNGVNGSISNNSWGNGTNNNVYDSYTAQFDGFVRDASAAGTIDPISLIFSAGNSGPGALSLTRPKAAKNVIATGNSENFRPELSSAANNIEDLTGSSSRGPSADGRVKPDIVAPGTVITGSRAGNCSSVSSCFETNHAFSSGTSHAAPQVAGAAALFTQFWRNGNGGLNPSPALIKAAILNTAQDMNGVNTGAAIPNGNEGWGRINMKFMLNTGVATKYVNQTNALSNVGDSVTFAGTVADGSKPTRVTLVWTDPPGASDPALVNNLDLRVTVGGNTYFGNVFTNGSSSTGGAADTRNNVENVFLPAGIPGGTTFSIQISAIALNGDGILGNGDSTDQHFGLVAYNLIETPTAVLQSAGINIVSETATPTNGVPDPGEMLTVSLAVQNVGSATASNVTATLQPTGGVTNPGPAQDYGTVVFNGPSVVRNFTFRVSPSVVCGDNITLTFALQDGATSLGTVSRTFRTGTVSGGSSLTAAYSGPPVAVPDNVSAGVNLAVPVSGVTGNITDINFRFDSAEGCNATVGNTNAAMDHTFVGDLVFKLTSPAGTTVTLMSQRAGTRENICTTLLDDDGGFPSLGTLSSTAGQFVSGNFAPDSALAAFDGQNANGNWTLNVADVAGVDVGSMRRFSLIFSFEGPSVCATVPATTTRPPADFDGDGKSDLSVFRPGDGNWYRLASQNDAFAGTGWGISGDKLVPGDYDGDGKADLAVFRPSDGNWYLNRSTMGITQAGFGVATDMPAQGDFDGDGKTDLAVFRPADGIWFIQQSTAGFTGIQFGAIGDKPVPGDYDGDGKTDIAVYRPSNGVWYLMRSTAGFTSAAYGIATDLVVPGDYDGDGKTDIAVYRPSNGTWYMLRSQLGDGAIQFGSPGDIPTPGDYDGDGKFDVSVFRPSDGIWYRTNSANSSFFGFQFGTTGDLPIPAAYVPSQ